MNNNYSLAQSHIARFTVAHPEPKKMKNIREAPEDLIEELATKIYPLCSLALDYVESVTDMATQMHKEEYKSAVRKIKELKKGHLYIMSKYFNEKNHHSDTKNGLMFEEYLMSDFKKAQAMIRSELSEANLSSEELMFMIGVYDAMILLKAVKRFSAICDLRYNWASIKVGKDCMLTREFVEIIDVFPRFCNKYFNYDSKGLKHGIKSVKELLDNVVVQNPNRTNVKV